jgi:hypothetical protein
MSRGAGGIKKDGSFEVWNVDPGKYFLTASWQGAGNQRVQTATVDIEIGQQNIDRLELRLIPPPTSPATSSTRMRGHALRATAARLAGSAGAAANTGGPSAAGRHAAECAAYA